MIALWTALLLVACAGRQQRELQQSYANLRALESSIEQPVSGSPLLSTYRNPRYSGIRFAAVIVEPPTIVAAKFLDREYRSFLENLRAALLDATARALGTAERFGTVLPGDAPRGAPDTVVCRVEASPHVTPSANALVRDPVFGEVRPRVIVVYTLSDAASGEVVLKYTEWAVSRWEYGPWAMEELVAAAVGISNRFGEVLKLF